MSVHVCRACDEVIADPADGVMVMCGLGNPGPGRDVRAHREHADDVELIGPDLLRIMTRIRVAQEAAR